MFSKLCLCVLIKSVFIQLALASVGDQSPYFQKCVKNCLRFNCTDDGREFEVDRQPLILKVTLWNCYHECKYECMWKTVDAFHERNWKTPQFNGKWPFIRVLGMQEPASVLFSILNGYVHFKMMKRFREKVRPNSPLVWLWNFFFLVCIHAWFWSAVFHYRDFIFTEFLDYACAFSLILMNGYVMSIRLLFDKVSKFVLIGISAAFLLFLLNHVAYLRSEYIDYGYNMELNIAVGMLSGLCWFAWCFYNRKRQKYVWKCAIYVALHGLSLLLELVDRPPIFYIFDFHSIWHLVTAPITIFMYSFAIDDCNYLRQKLDSDLKKVP